MPSGFGAAPRIVWDTFVFRLKQREMNNLPATIALMVAFHLPPAEIVVRGAFLLLLNVYVYLMNDLCDVAVDLVATHKDQRKVRFLADHRGAGWAALGLLGLGLLGAALWHSRLLLYCFAANTVLIFVYSRWLKRWPVVDVLAMALWGAAMPLCGLPSLSSDLGLRLLGLLAILCACYEVIQVLRDARADAEAGLRTTAVLLGTRTAAWIFRLLVVAAAGYGLHTLGSLPAFGVVVALLLPLDADRAARSWNWARLLFGACWLAILGEVYFGSLR